MKRASLLFLTLVGCSSIQEQSQVVQPQIVVLPIQNSVEPKEQMRFEAEKEVVLERRAVIPQKIAPSLSPAKSISRSPASTSPEGRPKKIAIDDSLPVLMICSGAANVPNVFSFSGEPEKLRVFFGLKGSSTVAGTAKISLRANGNNPVFEGPVDVSGTRTPDGRRYSLVGAVGTSHFSMDLIYNGTGTLYWNRENEKRERYEAHCQVEPQSH